MSATQVQVYRPIKQQQHVLACNVCCNIYVETTQQRSYAITSAVSKYRPTHRPHPELENGFQNNFFVKKILKEPQKSKMYVLGCSCNFFINCNQTVFNFIFQL